MGTACPACATEIPATARFCFSCGHAMVDDATPAADAVTTQAVTQELAAELRGPRAAGERRNITMLFCDLVDSTSTAQDLDPELWSEVISATMQRMIAPVERYGGTVARLLGDAILAYFGAPTAHEDDPQRAAMAAIEIRAQCEELAEEFRVRADIDLQVRIGINTGLVVVGEVGSDLYNEYAALGDAANVAARMEQTAEPGTIRMTEATYRRVSPFFDVEHVGGVNVKGRSEAVDTYVLLDVRATPGQIRGIEGVTAGLVGRDAELATLVEVVETVESGSGQVVTLVAQAGLGKSRLIEEAHEATASGARGWITGHCYSYEASTPYTPVRTALSAHLDLQGVDDPGERRRRIVADVDAVRDPSIDSDAVTEHLCWLLGATMSPEAAQVVALLEPPTLRARVLAAVTSYLEATANRRPTVLVIDDVHWADDTSLSLLEELLPVTERAPFGLVLLMRPRRDEGSWRLHETAARTLPHRSRTITLAPLSDAYARELVAELLHVEGLAPTVRELILSKAEGNPFFVEEVVRSLLDDGVIVTRDGEFTTVREVTDLDVPDSLSSVLVSRLDALAPGARDVIQLAAVIGREFALPMLDALAGTGDALVGVVEELQRRELISQVRAQPERVFRFHHALMRDAAYEVLLHSTRRRLHLAVGVYLEEHQPDRVHELARHFVEADDPRAVGYLVAAGQDAFAAYAGETATAYFEDALSRWQPEHGRDILRAAFEGLGNTRMFQADMTGAAGAFTRMRDDAESAGDQGMLTSALNKLGLVETVGFGDYDVARGSFDRAHANAVANDDAPAVAEFYVGYCILNTTIGDLDSAQQHLGEAVEFCQTMDPFYRNFGLSHYAHTMVLQLQFDAARTAVARAKAQAEADGDRMHLSHIKDTTAWLELVDGRPADALALAQAAVAEASEIGWWMGVVFGSWTEGDVARALGHHDTARAAYQRILDVGPGTGLFGQVAVAHVGIARLLQVQHGPGHPAIREHIDATEELLAMPMGVAAANHVRAEAAFALLGEGDLAAAGDMVERGRTVSSAMVKFAQPELLLCAGGIAILSGTPERGVELLAEGIAYIDDHGLGHLDPRARLAEASIAAVANDRPALLRQFEAADASAQRLGLHESALLIRATAADLLATVGAVAEADEFRRRMLDTVATIGSHIGDADERAAFLHRYAVSEVAP